MLQDDELRIFAGKIVESFCKGKTKKQLASLTQDEANLFLDENLMAVENIVDEMLITKMSEAADSIKVTEDDEWWERTR